MADMDLTPNQGVGVEKRQGRGLPSGTATVLAETANYNTITALRTRLAALDAVSFTTARMNTMTKNDLIYALRVRGDSSGI